MTGREIKQVMGGEEPVGQHRAVWDCTDCRGAPVAAGEYFIRLDTPTAKDVAKVVIAR